ncbi:X-box-binding protein 1-like [Dreissena polymorpha]|uniref:X-box-binding protein 1 n=1 Tax=Dreissena polymorpha TaxID=45954 RepID=A0A9D4S1K4_DREPO|nr:X-box-binding protein 1-like [Dreissena polymorpha]KAH3887130.1 hypothetical protein DPMN_011146 [Dreissena polymorpha]
MTTIQPHTIVIRTVQSKAPTTLTVTSQLEHDMLDDLYGDGGGARKRRRLTHLSQEEKLLRRKLKNRVAAQTARDRKKNLMSELEERVALLEEENRKLAMENQALKSESGSLQQLNEKLRGRLCQLGGEPGKTQAGGSAASVDLQQQGQTLPVSCSANAASVLTLSLTLLAFFRGRANPSSQPLSQRPRPYRARTCVKPSKKIHVPWWGPQQQSWNPSKN